MYIRKILHLFYYINNSLRSKYANLIDLERFDALLYMLTQLVHGVEFYLNKIA